MYDDFIPHTAAACMVRIVIIIYLYNLDSYTMSTVTDIDAQLIAIQHYIRSTMASLPAVAREQSTAGLIRSARLMIQSMPSLDIQGATALNNVVNNMTEVSQALKIELLNEIGSKHLQAASTSIDMKKCLQQFRSPENVFNGSDWAVFDDPTKHRLQKLTTATTRLKGMGLTNPMEKPTMQHIAGFMCSILWPEDARPTKTQSLAVVLDMKEMLKSGFPPYPSDLPRLVRFPDLLSDFPQCIRNHCYKDVDPAVTKIPASYLENVKFVKLRKDKTGAAPGNALALPAGEHGAGVAGRIGCSPISPR